MAKKHIGYQNALRMAEERLVLLSPEQVVANTGVTHDGNTFIIPWLGENIPLNEGTEDERVIWYHYLLGDGPKKLRERHINYKQVPGAAIYNDNFIKRAIDPMVKTFSDDLELFVKLGLEMGGKKDSLGHASFTLNVLPHVPLTYVLWQGDDEMPSNGNILFDESAIEWMCAEDLVVVASLPVYRMLKMKFAPKP